MQFDDPDLVADAGLSTPELTKRPGPSGPGLFSFAAPNESCPVCPSRRQAKVDTIVPVIVMWTDDFHGAIVNSTGWVSNSPLPEP